MSKAIEELGIDDIFSRLQETKKTNESENDSTGNTENLTYEQLKKKVTHLPSIELHLYNSKKEGEKSRKERDIRKINDSVESVLPGFNKNNKSLKNRRLEKQRKSDEWFSIPKVDMTDELKRDLLIIKNRKYLDPKRFYRGEKWEIPENFQVGEVINGYGENGGKNLTRKSKGKGFIDELLKSESSNEWFDKTFTNIQKEKRSGGKKFLKDKITKRKKY